MKQYNLRAWGISGSIWFRVPSSQSSPAGAAAGSQSGATIVYVVDSAGLPHGMKACSFTWVGVIWNHDGTTGVPLFPDMFATMECARFKMFTACDQEILIAKLLHANWRETEPPFHFGGHFGSQYRALESSPDWWSTI